MNPLFKAVSTRTKSWCKGFYSSDENYSFINQSGEFFSVSPETVCSSTGRLDKNQKQIFENDMVFVTTGDTSFTAVVRWSEKKLAWRLLLYYDTQKIKMFPFPDSFDTEVVGNFFDPPDPV